MPPVVVEPGAGTPLAPGRSLSARASRRDRAGSAGGGRRRRRAGAGWRRWLLRLGLVGVAGLLLVVALAAVAYRSVDLPAEPPRAQTSVVLDAEGNVLAELYDVENRVDVRLDEVSPTMVAAVIAAEDRSFRRHSGINPSSTIRALWVNVRGGDLQGGSTITQQLVKNTYLTPERSLRRKAQEAVLAVKVDRELSKDAILERYLNTIYFGRGAYGIEAAAKAYFGPTATARSLDVAQSALLAGLIRAPESADPSNDPETARARRASVLRALVATGAITQDEATMVGAAEIVTVPRDDGRATLRGSTAYFADQVRAWAVRTFGEAAAFGGGLRIETSLDPRMQAAAERAVFETLNEPGDPDGALVALDERGAVVAMIGGRSFEENEVNLALGADGGSQGRQPGSTFKPFVLAAALDAGIPVNQRFPGPSEITVDVGGQDYTVENFEGQGFGQIDLTAATASSVNTVYAQLVAATGAQAVADAARAAGITTPLEPLPSIALGVFDVSPLEMASSYMTYARRGNRITPWYVERVTEANGAVLYRAEPELEPVVPAERADLMNHVLREVIVDGTGTAADIGRPAAGKTGTTQDNTNAWFVGYTPRLGAAVWMGYGAEGRREMKDVRGRRVTGGGLPAQIWQRFMAAAVEPLDTGSFVAPRDEDLDPTTSAPPTTARRATPTTSTTSTSAPPTTADTTEAPETTTTSPSTTAAPQPTTTEAPPTPEAPTTSQAPAAPEAAPPPAGDGGGG
ncbi:MAG: Multimodular transpeptidase-transglycosylase [uncultured Acidimicrobiales bacterium]|uniref:Multimodular transpeptidase-transglycosylase n=1 Tax=uncultured Acidimicrobiales bacterium TaxID=310071 RepID=A0A6J4INR3_9ACTN|nr:MAG: Multimodular transpeptidase-transglycosylase [uncultured Acidimicrobiales bacterium]